MDVKTGKIETGLTEERLKEVQAQGKVVISLTRQESELLQEYDDDDRVLVLQNFREFCNTLNLSPMPVMVKVKLRQTFTDGMAIGYAIAKQEKEA